MILEVQREIQENKIKTAFPMLLCVKPHWNKNQLGNLSGIKIQQVQSQPES